MRRMAPRKGKSATVRRKAGSERIVEARTRCCWNASGHGAATGARTIGAGYVIFHDATFVGDRRRTPSDIDGLSTIHGIGAKKLERYGPALMALLRD